MISLLPAPHRARLARRDESWWPLLVAAALTSIYLGGLSLLWGSTAAPAFRTSTEELPSERVTFVPLGTSQPEVKRAPKSSGPPRHSIVRTDDGSPAAAPDSASPAAPLRTAPVSPMPAAVDAFTPSMSARLSPGRASDRPWYTAAPVRNPFQPAQPLSAAERESTLIELGAAVPGLAARRAPTRSERDARAKEAMLKMRLSGRILLVPPDNSGGLITSSIPLPILSRGPSKAVRRRDSAAAAIDQAFRDRLRQRADSLRQWRADSAAKVASPQ